MSAFTNPVLHAFQTLQIVLDASPGWTPHALLHYPGSDALTLPIILTAILIPSVYGLQNGSGNVSWVDRVWSTFPVVCSASVALWVVSNPTAGMYVPALPRMLLVLLLQTMWSGRLTGHSWRRGVYTFHSEDYRYTAVRKLVPAWAFELIHIFVICIAQPLLLLALCFPLRCMILPASLLSPGPSRYAIRLESFPLPAYLKDAAAAAGVPGQTPVIHIGDVALAALSLAILFLEGWGDNAMWAFQQGKYRSIRRLEKAAEEKKAGVTASSTSVKSKPAPRLRGRGRGKASRDTQQAEPVPEVTAPSPAPAAKSETQHFAPKFFPGFPTAGIHSVSRHPNFASEQLFWLIQGLFAVFAGSTPTRSPGRMQCALVPSFCLALLFCASTALTEWLTTSKYPQYKAYRQLVGKFLPQETAIKWLWTTVKGTRDGLERELTLTGERTESNCLVL